MDRILVEYRNYKNDEGNVVSNVSFVNPITYEIEIFKDENELNLRLKELREQQI